MHPLTLSKEDLSAIIEAFDVVINQSPKPSDLYNDVELRTHKITHARLSLFYTQNFREGDQVCKLIAETNEPRYVSASSPLPADNVLNLHITQTGLQTRVVNSLLNAGIYDIQRLCNQTPRSLKRLRNISDTGVQQITAMLERYGARLQSDTVLTHSSN